MHGTQAKLYEARRDYAAAEQLHRYTLSRLEQAGQPLGADAVEALLFLAAVCKVSWEGGVESAPATMEAGGWVNEALLSLPLATLCRIG